MNQSKQVDVIGAGPAGLVAATSLARSGHWVTVSERRPGVETGFTGGWRVLDNWTRDRLALDVLREWGVGTEFDAMPVREVAVIGPDSERARYRAVAPIAYLVPRSGGRSLDSALLRQAKQAGVSLRFGREVRRSTAPRLVVATGPATVDGIVRGATFRTKAHDGVTVFLDDRVAPRGLGLVIVLDGTATIETHMFDRFADALACLRLLWLRAKSEIGLTQTGEAEVYGYPLSYSVPGRWTDGRRHFVGAAGGFQDALLGAGCMLAIESARLVADALSMDYSYDTACRETLLPRLRTGLTNRLLFSQLGNLGYSAVIERFADLDPLFGLRKLSHPDPSREALYELSAARLHPVQKDLSCHSDGCECVRCRHGRGDDLSSLEACFEERAVA